MSMAPLLLGKPERTESPSGGDKGPTFAGMGKVRELEAMRAAFTMTPEQIVEFTGAKKKEEQEYAVNFYKDADLVISCVGLRYPEKLKGALKGVHSSLPEYCKAIVDYGEENAAAVRDAGVTGHYYDAARALLAGKTPVQVKRFFDAEPELLQMLAQNEDHPACSAISAERAIEFAKEFKIEGRQVAWAALAFQRLASDRGGMLDERDKTDLYALARSAGANNALNAVATQGIEAAKEAARLGFKELSKGGIFVKFANQKAAGKNIDFDAYAHAAMRVAEELKVGEAKAAPAFAYLFSRRGKPLEENAKALVELCTNSGDAAACLDALATYSFSVVDSALKHSLHPFGGAKAVEMLNENGVPQDVAEKVLALTGELSKEMQIEGRLQGKVAEAILSKAVRGSRIDETAMGDIYRLLETASANNPDEVDYVIEALAKYELEVVEAACGDIISSGMPLRYIEIGCDSILETGAHSKYDPATTVTTRKVYADSLMAAAPEVKAALRTAAEYVGNKPPAQGETRPYTTEQELITFLRPLLVKEEITALEKLVSAKEVEQSVAGELRTGYVKMLRSVAGIKTGDDPKELEGIITEKALDAFCKKARAKAYTELEKKGKEELLALIRPKDASERLAELKLDENAQDYRKLLEGLLAEKVTAGEIGKEEAAKVPKAANIITWVKTLLSQEGLASHEIAEGEEASDAEIKRDKGKAWAVPKIRTDGLSFIVERLDAALTQQQDMGMYGIFSNPPLRLFDSEIESHVPLQREYLYYIMSPRQGGIELPPELVHHHVSNAIAYARVQRRYGQADEEQPYEVGGAPAKLVTNMQSDIPQAHDPHMADRFGNWDERDKSVKREYDDWERVLVMGLEIAASKEGFARLAFPTPSAMVAAYPELNSDSAFRIYAEALYSLGARLTLSSEDIRIDTFRRVENKTNVFWVLEVVPLPKLPPPLPHD